MLMDKTVAVASTGAIFLDRDGVINENRPDHVKSWDEFEFLSDVLTSVRRLSQTGMPIFVVTNQAAIGRGLVLESTVQEINARMVETFAADQGTIEKAYYCPHTEAALEYSIDLTQSFMVGDSWTDVEAGLAVGARSILVMTGRGRGNGNLARCLTQYPVRFGAAVDLADATTMILSALDGEPLLTTPRMRRAFHLALSPHELSVL
jgi:D-glycero-D-manno-heptose 1,7-bisphosphate phosphatase